MDDKQVFFNKSKEELIEIILALQKQIYELKEQLPNKKDPPKFIKPNLHKRHQKPGQKIGHIGTGRFLPEHVDETINQTLPACPRCYTEFDKPAEVIEHTQEDIIPAYVKITKYRRHRYWCSCCQAFIEAPYHESEIPDGKIGPNVLIQTAILKYKHCLPYGKISELFKELCGIQISAGSLAQSLQRLSRWLKIEQQTILSAIRDGPVIHIDETGWRLDGKNHWLWAFVNKKLAYYRIESSRGRKIVKDTLTDKYQGTIISDFYGVYFNLPYKKQKCLVHLLRELRNTAKHDDSAEYLKFYKQIKRIVKDAVRLKELKPVITSVVFQRKFKRIKERLFMLIGGIGSANKNINRIASRFSKFWLDMLTFIEIDDVDWNNNLAERLIRPHVIYRNRSFGNRSLNGTKAHAVLTSVIQSLTLQKRNIFESLKTSFLAHRKGVNQPLLFSTGSEN